MDQEPVGPPTPAGIDPAQVRRRRLEPVVLVAWLGTLSLIAANWTRFPSPADGLNLATVATALYFGWKASLAGGLWELLSIVQLVGGVAVGYLGRDFFAGLFGFPGVLGGIFGFYSGFLFTWLGIAILTYFVRDQSRLPGPVMRFLGLVLGAAEGILLTGVVGYALTLAPGLTGPADDSGPRPLATALVEQAVTPLVPASASGTIELVKVAREMKKGFDPQRVDREELARQFAPLAQHPKLQEAANDPELRALAEKGNPVALMQHPKVRALLSDPDLAKLATSVNLHKVAEALRQGLLPSEAR